MRKTGSKKIRFKKIFLLPICVSKTILIVLQSARRVNDDLAARLNIFHDRDHLLLWNSDASAGRACFAVPFCGFPHAAGADIAAGAQILALGSVRLIFRRINRCRTNQRAA